MAHNRKHYYLQTTWHDQFIRFGRQAGKIKVNVKFVSHGQLASARALS